MTINNRLSCINLSYFMDRTKAKPDLLMEIISIYLKQTPPLVKAMRQGFENEDWEQLESAVHKLIPSFSIIGMDPKFENMARKVNEFANNPQQSEGISELVDKLELVCTQACKELEEELKKLKS